MKIILILIILIALMMEAERTSETLVNFYQTTRRYNPEDSHLRTHHCENLKSYLIFMLSKTFLALRPFKMTENTALSVILMSKISILM
jgi:hypothetical protein